MEESSKHTDKKLQQWLEGSLSTTEWEAYKQSIEDPQYLEQLEKTIRQMDQWEVPKPKLTTDQAWDAFQERLVELDKTPVVPLWRKPLVISIAASLLLIFCVWFFWKAPPTEVYSPVATLMNYELPDETSIKLNADSKIFFSSRGFKKDRLVKLQGEAFFEVKKGSQFVVESDYGDITVLGTSFNVYAREDRFEVACATGRVQVSVPGKAPVVLGAGMSTRFEDGDMEVTQSFDPEHLLDWQKGDFYFKNTHLPVVFDELQRQLGITIIPNTPVEGMIYTGFFNRADRDAALQSVLEPMGLKYQIRDDTVVVE